jgi:hypothetical protein
MSKYVIHKITFDFEKLNEEIEDMVNERLTIAHCSISFAWNRVGKQDDSCIRLVIDGYVNNYRNEDFDYKGEWKITKEDLEDDKSEETVKRIVNDILKTVKQDLLTQYNNYVEYLKEVKNLIELI